MTVSQSITGLRRLTKKSERLPTPDELRVRISSWQSGDGRRLAGAMAGLAALANSVPPLDPNFWQDAFGDAIAPSAFGYFEGVTPANSNLDLIKGSLLSAWHAAWLYADRMNSFPDWQREVGEAARELQSAILQMEKQVARRVKPALQKAAERMSSVPSSQPVENAILDLRRVVRGMNAAAAMPHPDFPGDGSLGYPAALLEFGENERERQQIWQLWELGKLSSDEGCREELAWLADDEYAQLRAEIFADPSIWSEPLIDPISLLVLRLAEAYILITGREVVFYHDTRAARADTGKDKPFAAFLADAFTVYGLTGAATSDYRLRRIASPAVRARLVVLQRLRRSADTDESGDSWIGELFWDSLPSSLFLRDAGIEGSDIQPESISSAG